MYYDTDCFIDLKVQKRHLVVIKIVHHLLQKNIFRVDETVTVYIISNCTLLPKLNSIYSDRIFKGLNIAGIYYTYNIYLLHLMTNILFICIYLIKNRIRDING